MSVFDQGSPVLLTCEMKAPLDSIVYWSQTQEPNQECIVPTLNSNTSTPINIQACNTTAVVNQTVDLIDDAFSIFHLELKVKKLHTILENNIITTDFFCSFPLCVECY